MVMAFILVASGVLKGCAVGYPEGFDEDEIAAAPPIRGGAALGLRKLEMQRALRDMTIFHETMGGMIARRDRRGVDAFSSFVTAYFKSHLNPMLRAEWQSRHAELIDLDVNLRVLEADVLAQMGSSREVHRVLDTLQSRYEGRENLLVDFPIGEGSPLGEVVELIKLRLDSCTWGRVKWRSAGRSEVRGAVSQVVCLGPA